jgi:MFS family permease
MHCETDFKSFYMLMLGRLLGGVATSLLFSVFDAWLIRSHSDQQLKQYLGKSFSLAAYGNSAIAIAAGLVANNAAGSMGMTNITDGMYIGGYLIPFDLALMALVVCGFLAATTWEENYGESDGSDAHKANWHDGLRNAFTATIRSTDILLCGIISSLFEGSMYVSTVRSPN